MGALSGREVLNHVSLTIIEQCEKRGVKRHRLLDGLGITYKQLENRRERHSWGDFIELLRRSEQELGPNANARMWDEIIVTSKMLGFLASMVVGPRDLFVHVGQRMTRRLYTVIGQRYEDLPDGRLRIETLVPEPYGCCRALFVGSLTTYRAYPRLIGLPDATVDADIGDRRAVYFVTLPPSRTVGNRIRRWVGIPSMLVASPAFGARSDGNDRKMLEFEMAMDESSLVRAASDLGQQLVCHDNLDTLADSFFRLMREQFCSQHIELWVRLPDAKLSLVRSLETGSVRATCVRELSIGSKPVGRIVVDVPEAVVGEPNSFFDMMLMWLAIGVERCSSSPRNASLTEHLEKSIRRWNLTPRQGEVLQLVIKGCPNKEIADILGCSTKVVETHITGILKKAKADSRGVLTAKYWQDREASF